MNTANLEAVFVTGLVRNSTTRFTLDEKILKRYKTCCESIIKENEHVATHYLYDQATAVLQKLIDNPDAAISIIKLEAVKV